MLEPHSIYAREKLRSAIATLVTHPGKIRDRLRVAALDVVLVPRSSLPVYEGVDQDLEWIYSQLTDREEAYEGQGRINASIDRMRSARASAIADRILTAFAKLDAYIASNLRA